jgi:hypothetical protein
VVDEKMWDADDDEAQAEGEERKEKYDDRTAQVWPGLWRGGEGGRAGGYSAFEHSIPRGSRCSDLV